MSITTDDYLKRAAECEQLAGACIADPTAKSILLYAAACWRAMAEDFGACRIVPAESERLDDTARGPRRLAPTAMDPHRPYANRTPVDRHALTWVLGI